MSHYHHHDHCEHEMAHCEKCDVAYCRKCGREWPAKEVQPLPSWPWPYWYQPYAPPYQPWVPTQPTIIWGELGTTTSGTMYVEHSH